MIADGILHKLEKISNLLAGDRPDVTLFAALQRSGLRGSWDVVVAALWAISDKAEAYKYIGGLLQENLTRKEMIMISRIVLFHPDDEPVRDLTLHAMPWKQGIKMLSGCQYVGDQLILEGYIFIGKGESELSGQAH
jgi:hypothetical protein